MLMLDLCCGLGGASRAMRERGWEVVTVDIVPEFNPLSLPTCGRSTTPGPARI